MKIQCPKCLTNYNINLSLEEMPREGSIFSCQNCSSQFFVRKKQENFFISLMKNIKGKLDDWGNDIGDKALSKDEKDTRDVNQQENTEDSAEEINRDVDDLLNEILEEEKLKEASLSADQPHLVPETEMTAEDATHEKREKIIEEEESQQIEETLQELPDAVAEEQPPSPTEEPATASETEGEPGWSSDQSDVDKMFEEATVQQLEGTLEEQFPPPEKQASTSDLANEDIDDFWATALEEATDSDEKKPDELSTVESNKFQNDLENLLKGTDQETDASSEKINEKVEAKVDADSKTDQLPAPASPVSDDASESVVEGQEETTAMEATSSEEDVAATETELTDKRKVVKFLIPTFITLSLISGGGYWYFSKLGDSEMTIAKVDDNETITVAKVAKKTETIEPVPAQDAKEAETTEPYSAEESKPDDRSSVVKENREVKAQKKEMKQSVIPVATYPVSKGRTESISIGSIVPVVFSQDEIRVMSVNIKLDIDNKKVYEQVKKGFPFFEEKVESTIEKYFEGKFYRDIQFVQEKLRKELHEKLNQEVKGGEIKGVELEDFLIQ